MSGLTIEHVEWLLRELEIRTVPSMPGGQVKQVAVSQMTVENALRAHLQELRTPTEKDAEDGDRPATAANK
jgi:hypothetical protein